jgi:hypothetical protein
VAEERRKDVTNMTTPSDAQIVKTAFMDEPMSLVRLVGRTGLTALRVNNALDELVERGYAYLVGQNLWSLKPLRKGSQMSEVPTPPTPPSPPAKKVNDAKKAAKKVPAPAKTKGAKKAVKKAVAKKVAAPRNDGVKKAEIDARDTRALSIIAKSKGGLTKTELAEAMGEAVGLVHMSVYRLNRDGRIQKTKGESREAKWVATGK